MKKLTDSLSIRRLQIRNRICIPPMVMFGMAEANHVSEQNIAHYQALARGGAGLVIVEATCISPTGKLSHDQLGLWEDSQIEGFRRLTAAVKAEGAAVFVQIHHAGINGVGDVHDCPSDYEIERFGGTKIHGEAMSAAKITAVIQQFADAAHRAWQAGFDGVELHGCHGYLICQFLDRKVNQRTDVYGHHPELLVVEIVQAIRKVTPEDFVVGIRLGLNEPDIEDGLAHAAVLAPHVDFINASHGFFPPDQINKPAGFGFANLTYAGVAIKQAAPGVPVFAVGGIRTTEQAQELVARYDVDMVAIGKSALVNPDWPHEALAGHVSKACLQCKTCVRFRERDKCPGSKLPRT
jgi:NADPH2 dehydrogenase